MKRSLAISINGEIVATLAEPRTNKFTITYAETAPPDSALSVMLPVDPDRYSPSAVAGFIAGLVPSLDRREELAEVHEVPSHLIFRFLDILGSDLPGATVFTPPGESPGLATTTVTSRPITEADLGDELAVVRVSGDWQLPDRGVPSSHFLRIEDPILPGSAAAEAFALGLAAAAGLRASPAETTSVLGRRAVAVTRPDRQVTPEGITRSHVESFAQICGIDTVAYPDSVYEEEEGPSFRDVAEAVATHTPRPKPVLEQLAGLMVFHATVGNTNAHAGSYTIDLPSRDMGSIHTALPAEFYTELETEEGVIELDHRLAMSINDFWKTDALDHEDLVREASSWPGLTREAATAAIDATVAALQTALPVAIGQVPEVPPALLDMIRSRIDQYRPPGSVADAD